MTFNNLLKIIASSVIATGLVACATDNYPKPKPLPKLENQVNIHQVWTNSDLSKLVYPGTIIPAIYEDLVYAADSNGKLLKISLDDGVTKYHSKLNYEVGSGIIVNDTDIIFVSNKAQLVAVSKNTGKVSWEKSIPTLSDQAPQAIGGNIIVKTIDGQTWGYDAATGELNWVNQNQIFSLSLKAVNSFQVIPEASVIIDGMPNGRVSLVNSQTGISLWDTFLSLPKGSTDLDKVNDVAIRPIYEGRYIFLANYNGKLVAVDGSNGSIVWSKDFSTSQGIVRDANNIYAVDQDGVLYAFEKNSGAQLWSNDVLKYRKVSMPIIYSDRILLIENDGTMHLFSNVDGDEISRKSTNLKDGISQPLYINKNRIVIQSANGYISMIQPQ